MLYDMFNVQYCCLQANEKKALLDKQIDYKQCILEYYESIVSHSLTNAHLLSVDAHLLNLDARFESLTIEDVVRWFYLLHPRTWCFLPSADCWCNTAVGGGAVVTNHCPTYIIGWNEGGGIIGGIKGSGMILLQLPLSEEVTSCSDAGVKILCTSRREERCSSIIFSASDFFTTKFVRRWTDWDYRNFCDNDAASPPLLPLLTMFLCLQN